MSSVPRPGWRGIPNGDQKENLDKMWGLSPRGRATWHAGKEKGFARVWSSLRVLAAGPELLQRGRSASRAARASTALLPASVTCDLLRAWFCPPGPGSPANSGSSRLCRSSSLRLTAAPGLQTGRKEHLPQSRRCRRPGAQSARLCRKCLESKTRSPTREFLQPARRRESPPLLSCGFPEPPGTAARFHHPKPPEFLRGSRPPISPIPLSPAELPAAPKDQTAASSSSLSTKIQAPHTNPSISPAPEPDLKRPSAWMRGQVRLPTPKSGCSAPCTGSVPPSDEAALL